MDFSIPQSTRQLIGQIREFVQTEICPLEGHLGGEFRALEGRLEEIRQAVRARGWWLPQIPVESGGMGLSLLEHGLVSAELGRSPLGHYCFNCQAPDAGNMEILLEHGSDWQKEVFLGPLLAGRTRSCFAMTEPDYPGSNPVWMGTRAIRDGDDYVLSGRKWFASSADGAAFAVVMAETTPDAAPHGRASMLIVAADTPGYRLVRNIPCMGHAGDSWMSHGEIAFEECRVPVRQRLGREGAGFAIAQARLGPGRIHHCMRWLGICERSFELMCRRAASRRIAPGVFLGSQQIVQEWIAQSRMEIDSARLSVLHAAWRIDQEGSKAARDEVSCIKFQVANTLQRVVDRAIQVHGGLGISDDTPLAFFYRHERAARIYDGADEVHKASLAKRILRRFGMEG